MIQIHAAFGHDLFKVSIRNGKSDVEIHGVQDHGFRVLRAFETDQTFNPDCVSGNCGVWPDAPGNATEIQKFAILRDARHTECCRHGARIRIAY